MEEPVKEFGTNLRSLREERGLTQKEVAEAAGIRQPHLSKLERGLHDPQMRTATKLARALGVEVREIWPGSCPQ